MLDRSRSSTPGRSAMRWSIVGVAVNVVTRCRSIASTARAASNFSSTTSRSPASRLCSVANALTWYIGASTRIVCGRATGRHCSIIGVLKTRVVHRGHRAHDHLRRPGRAAAADALHRRRHDVGQVGHVASAVAAIQGRSSADNSVLGSMTCRIRSSSQSGRSHRTGIGSPPPSSRRAPRTRTPASCAARSPPGRRRRAALGERAGHLARPSVELGPGERLLGAVDADVDVHLRVRLFVGQLPQPLDEASGRRLGPGRSSAQQGSGAPKIDPHSRSSKLNSASSTKLPSSPSGAGASGSKR